jgi:hypothetical protein
MDCALEAGSPRLDWFPDWSGQTAVIVASGPSASYVETLAALRMEGLRLPEARARCVAINESHRLAPWADVLYAADYFWWLKHKGVPGFNGLKVSVSPEAAERFPGLKHIELDRIVAAGRNSGAQALLLAAQLGATRILLVGYDMTLERGVHWHGAHGGGSQNPTKGSIARWREALDGAAPGFAAAGIEVLNCSPVSALTAYPKVDFRAAIGAAQARAA